MLNDPYTWILLALVAVFAVMIGLNASRRKRARTEYDGMLNELRPGMRVKTVGGVIGRIKEIREEAPTFKTVLLETGTDKNPTLVLYDIQAIAGVINEESLNSVTAAAELSSYEQAQKQAEQPTYADELKAEAAKKQKSKPAKPAKPAPAKPVPLADFNARDYVDKRNATAKKNKQNGY